MLISHRKKFIFVKVPKTAGTAVEIFLEKYCLPEGKWNYSHHTPELVGKEGIVGMRNKPKLVALANWRNHMTATEIYDQVEQKVWNSYLKVCTIRNPFDMLLSAFWYRVEYLKTIDLTNCRREEIIAHFREFASVRLNGNLYEKYYMVQEQIVVDEFIRFEHLQLDLEKLCDKLGFDFDLSRLKLSKKTKKIPSIKNKDYYTDFMIQKIRENYQFEIERFGYTI